MVTLESILAVDTDAARRTVEAEIRNRMEAAGGKLVMAGAGALGRATLTAARRAGLTPVAFADNNAALAGKEIEGVPVMPSVPTSQSWSSNPALLLVACHCNPPGMVRRTMSPKASNPYVVTALSRFVSAMRRFKPSYP